MRLTSTLRKFLRSSDSREMSIVDLEISEVSGTNSTFDSEVRVLENRKLKQHRHENRSSTDWRKHKRGRHHPHTLPPLDKTEDCSQPSYEDMTNDVTMTPIYQGGTDQWAVDVSKKVISSPAFIVGSVTVKAEEIGLVVVVLMIWAGAISLFINRWGKLRMLEPYQPAYTAPSVTSPPRPQQSNPPPPFININIQSMSSLSLNESYHRKSLIESRSFLDWGAGSSFENPDEGLESLRGYGCTQSMKLGMERSSSAINLHALNPQRKVRSAVDLVSLVMQEKLNAGNGGDHYSSPHHSTHHLQQQQQQYAATNI